MFFVSGSWNIQVLTLNCMYKFAVVKLTNIKIQLQSRTINNETNWSKVNCKPTITTTTGSASPTKFPCQVLSVAEHILFTERCEEALKGGDLNGYLLELEGQLDSYTSTDINPTGPEDR